MIKLAKGSTGNWMIMISPKERQDLAAACAEAADLWRERRSVALRCGETAEHDRATMTVQRLEALEASLARD